uniref:Uncharacterized protein n=1 Tax=Heterorhabditis bacteriophora TaxID=37862 RepID=A0A1I7WRY0_HETBA
MVIAVMIIEKATMKMVHVIVLQPGLGASTDVIGGISCWKVKPTPGKR